MSLRWNWRTRWCALLAAACALVLPGCACCRLCPRIDPSGERIFLWPGETPSVAPAPVVAPPPGLAPPVVAPPPVITTPPPPPPPPTVGLPPGNLQAPPAYPDAGIPTAPPPTTTPPVITVPTPAPPAAAAPVAPLPSIDAQVAFPAPTIAQAGQPLVLTTIVTRRTDRAPLAGWTVRYEVANSGTAASPIDVPTDPTGRASIQISPMNIGAGEAVVNMSVMAPPDMAASAGSSQEVGRSTATISWRDGVPGAPPWAPPPVGLSSASPAPSLAGPPLVAPSLSDSPEPATPPDTYERTPNRFEPPPSLSDSDSSPKTYGPPPKIESTRKPELIVDVRLSGPDRVEVGGFTRFDVTVTNRGDATARNIKVLDSFDPGLSHVRAEDDEHAVKYEGMRDLAPGESATVPLTFGVTAAGRQCHRVTVTADDAADATGSGCITAIEARPASPPTLEVTKLGPPRHYVGEIAKFRVVIKNTGDVPVTNVEIVDHYDAAFEPRFTDPGREILPDGSFQWKIARLEKGERREFNVQCACVTPTPSACSRVTVTANGDLFPAEERCVEILPLAATPPTAAGGVAPPPPLPAERLKLSLSSTVNPGRVGRPMLLVLSIENLGQQAERNVALRVQLPKETSPIAAQIEPPGAAEIVGQLEVRFANVGNIGPGESRQFKIPLQALSPGVVTFVAQLYAEGMTQPLVKESNPIQIESASQ